MAEPSTVARPYAEAAFKLADGADALSRWSDMVSALALVAQDARVERAVADPNLSDAQVAGLFIAILGGRLSAEAENFVRVLARNKRLELLPEIRAQFEALKNAREGLVEAEVQSAFELTEAQVADIVQRLERKTGRKVKARVSVERELIGGVKVTMGDKVIDGSARAQLAALEAALKA
ncbi:MAG TPA: F0F1 ATP synthase subunit delta [Burkholderiales bacterium]|nr:F0F1 ATP synthase subunit delta [Burkholderiales bacterium]